MELYTADQKADERRVRVRNGITRELNKVEKELRARFSENTGDTSITSILDYRHLVRKGPDGVLIWTEAIQTALYEHQTVRIPEGTEPYYIDTSLIIPSGRSLLADPSARIRLLPGVKVLMLRNEHTVDGTHCPPDTSVRDRDIRIHGGIWEEPADSRGGYGRSGMYDTERSYYGVSTCMLFNNLDNLILEDITFSHTAGFAVQTGDLKNSLMENIRFHDCYADGLHINGNCENLIIRNISGEVGDDLVALNAYDWQNSSVNFGPIQNVLCEKLVLSPQSACKAMRLEIGTYAFSDGLTADCAIRNAVIREVNGIRTFKLYFQTPPYTIGDGPEWGAVGSADNLFFEDIDIDLDRPIDLFPEYLNSDPVRGAFAAFEFGANTGSVSFENISLRLYRERYPMSFLLCAGPKSCRSGQKEIFDPYLSSQVQSVHVKNVRINGRIPEDIRQYCHEIRFDDINHDGRSSGEGRIEAVYLYT